MLADRSGQVILPCDLETGEVLPTVSHHPGNPKGKGHSLLDAPVRTSPARLKRAIEKHQPLNTLIKVLAPRAGPYTTFEVPADGARFCGDDDNGCTDNGKIDSISIAYVPRKDVLQEFLNDDHKLFWVNPAALQPAIDSTDCTNFLILCLTQLRCLQDKEKENDNRMLSRALCEGVKEMPLCVSHPGPCTYTAELVLQKNRTSAGGGEHKWADSANFCDPADLMQVQRWATFSGICPIALDSKTRLPLNPCGASNTSGRGDLGLPEEFQWGNRRKSAVCWLRGL